MNLFTVRITVNFTSSRVSSARHFFTSALPGENTSDTVAPLENHTERAIFRRALYAPQNGKAKKKKIFIIENIERRSSAAAAARAFRNGLNKIVQKGCFIEVYRGNDTELRASRR